MAKNWKQDWQKILDADGSRDKLVNDFVIRWKRNSPNYIPANLHIHPHQEEFYQWWDALQAFLLDDQFDNEGRYTNIIIESIKSAINSSKPNIEWGEVWIMDILALRRAKNSTDNDLNDLIALIFQMIDSLSDVELQAELETYMAAERIYGELGDCMVSEIYEKNIVLTALGDNEIDLDFSKFGSSSFTIFHILERDRLKLYSDENAEHPEQKFILTEEIARAYQYRTDRLIHTFTALNLKSAGEKNINNSVFVKFLLLIGNQSKNLTSTIFEKWFGNDVVQHYNLNRYLDYQWLRFCHLASPEMAGLAAGIRKYVRFMNEKDPDACPDVADFALEPGDELIRKDIGRWRLVPLDLLPRFGGAQIGISDDEFQRIVQAHDPSDREFFY
ncbi:hypothetical protein N8071_00440 [bacterium]|nr:hypothetical protein [bacterium]